MHWPIYDVHWPQAPEVLGATRQEAKTARTQTLAGAVRAPDPRSCHPGSNQGYKYILTVKDHFSTFVWLRKLKRKNKNAVFKKLQKIFRDFRAPDILQADNGGEFKNIALSHRQMQALLKKLKLKPMNNMAGTPGSYVYESVFGDGFTTDDLAACFPNTHMVHSRVRASSTNGSVERANQDVQRLLFYMMMRHAAEHPDEADVWTIHLDKVCTCYP